VDFTIVSADEFSWAVARILGAFTDQRAFDAMEGNRAWYWYIIGCTGTDEYFVIDLAPERYERCYYTHLYLFGQRGSTPVMATSFQDLLQRLYRAAEDDDPRYWERESLGDAYD
jgi:hypothetical protein